MSADHKRRDFLKGGSGTLLALLLQGCGSGGSDFSFSGSPTGSNGPSNNNPNQLPTGGRLPGVSVSGRVNLSELGGSSLNLFSLHQNTSPVTSGGLYTTTVSGQKVQVLFLTDGGLRGVTLYIPGDATSLEVGLDSTAVAVIFLTAGITSVEPAEATARVARIRSLSSFAPLKAYLASRLPTVGLAAVLVQPQFLSLRDACVNEYFAVVQALQAGPEDSGFSAELRQSNDGYDLNNSAWRYVSVIREELDADGRSVGTPQVPDLQNTPQFSTQPTNIFGGANPAGWGTLWTGQIAGPTGASDIFQPDQRTKTLRYWVQGPGGATDPEALLPATIQPGDFGRTHYLANIFFYFMLPAVDVISGGLVGFELYQAVKNARNTEVLTLLYDLLAGTANELLAIDGLKGNLASNDTENVKAAICDLLVACANLTISALPLIVETLVEGDLVILLAPALDVVGTLFLIGGIGFSLYNWGHAITNWFQLPSLTKIDVPVLVNPVAITTVGDFFVDFVAIGVTQDGTIYAGNQISPIENDPSNRSYRPAMRIGKESDGLAREVSNEYFLTNSSDGSYVAASFYGSNVVNYYREGQGGGASIPTFAGPNFALNTGSALQFSVNNQGQVAFVIRDISSPEMSARRDLLAVYSDQTGFTERIDIADLLGLSGQFIWILSVSINDEGEVIGVLRLSDPATTDLDSYLWKFKPRQPLTGQQARAEILLNLRRRRSTNTDSSLVSARANNRGDIVYQLDGPAGESDKSPLFLRKNEGTTIRLARPALEGDFQTSVSQWAYALNEHGHVACSFNEYRTQGDGLLSALLYRVADAAPVQLGSFYPTAINDDDLVVGSQIQTQFAGFPIRVVVSRPS